MFLTEREIFEQYPALGKTYRYFLKKSDEVREFFQQQKDKSLTFIGCGSSYFQCRSAEISARQRLGIPAHSIAAGDLLINFSQYHNLLKDTVIIAPSRSGATSEVVLSVKKAKQEFGCPIVCVCAREDSELSRIADLSLEIPWAFDRSVCQTRSVTNIYAADLLLIAAIAGDKKLADEIGAAVKAGGKFQRRYKNTLQEIARKKSWSQVVVLADSELEGIASAGALSFKEISLTPSFYYHLLDVRHGPILLIDSQTLVIMACSPTGISYQKDLIYDLKKKSPTIVTVSREARNIWKSDYHISLPVFKNFAVTGIPFIFVPQAISLYQAIGRGINPDLPRGLSPWIVLKDKK